MSCAARKASSLQSMLNFFMGLLRKRGEKIFVILCSGGGALAPPSSYAAVTVPQMALASSAKAFGVSALSIWNLLSYN